MRALVAWREGLFLTEGKIGVLSVSSLFLTRVGVYVCVCVYTHTHTHTAQMGYLDVSPGVGMRHLEGLKNPDGLNLSIHIFVYVYKVHMCIYILRASCVWSGFISSRIRTFVEKLFHGLFMKKKPLKSGGVPLFLS